MVSFEKIVSSFIFAFFAHHFVMFSIRYIQTRLNYGPVSTMLLLFISAREMVDADFQDHIPLLGPQTSHTRYTTEEGLEEVKVEEGAPVKCFPCRDCVIL